MWRKVWFWLVVVTLAISLAMPSVVQAQMGRFRGGMGDANMRRDAQTIHQLFTNYRQIHRTVQEIPNGIRSVTESDTPQVAALIQSHVAKMYDRVAHNQPIPMLGMSTTLQPMLQAPQHYQRQLTLTAKGVEVTETSTDPNLVAIIRAHAKEVTQFTERGMGRGMMGRL